MSTTLTGCQPQGAGAFPKPVPQAVRREVGRLWAAGMPAGMIARRCGVSRGTVAGIARRARLPDRPPGRLPAEEAAAWRAYDRGETARMPEGGGHAAPSPDTAAAAALYRCGKCGRTFARWTGAERRGVPVSVPTVLGGAPVCAVCAGRVRRTDPWGVNPEAIA